MKLNLAQSLFIQQTRNEEADYLLTEITSKAMLTKLAKMREKGRQGWFKLDVISNSKLKDMLKKHVDKDDMVDVLNIAAMILVRTELYGDLA